MVLSLSAVALATHTHTRTHARTHAPRERERETKICNLKVYSYPGGHFDPHKPRATETLFCKKSQCLLTFKNQLMHYLSVGGIHVKFCRIYLSRIYHACADNATDGESHLPTPQQQRIMREVTECGPLLKTSTSHRRVFQYLRVLSYFTFDFQQCGMCNQQRLRPACAHAQSDQSIC